MNKRITLFLVLSVLIIPATILAETVYRVIPIESPFGFRPTAINNSGQVTGNIKVSVPTIGQRYHAAIWSKDQGMTDLGVVFDYDDHHSLASEINDVGQVTGSCNAVGTVWNANNDYTTMGNVTWPADINNSGQVTGTSRSKSPYNAFIWQPSKGLLPLGSLGGSTSHSYGKAINEHGQIVGDYEGTGYRKRAFFWQDTNNNWQSDPGEMVDLGSFDGHDLTTANDINDNGLIVGMSYLVPDSRSRRAFWTMPDAGEIFHIGNLGGDTTVASAVNNLGQIVGWSKTDQGDTHAFISRTEIDSMVDLNDILLDDNWVVSDAYDINDNGQIIGWASYDNRQRVPVLLDPIPEPTTGLMFILGSGLCFIKRKLHKD